MIHIPRPAPLIVPSRRAIGVRGFVTCVLRDAVTGAELQRVGPFKNTYTDAGLNLFSSLATNLLLFGDASASAYWLGASTDTAAPVTTDTVLAGEITPANTNRTQAAGLPATAYAYNNSGSPDFYSVKLTRVFSSTQAVGTIAKLGLFSLSSGGTLVAETLITDAGGTPTTIPKVSGTTLTVTWEFDWIPPQADTVSTVTINGVVYTLTSRACNVGVANSPWGGAAPSTTGVAGMGGLTNTVTFIVMAALAARNAAPVSAGSVGASSTAYVAGSFHRDYVIANASATMAALAITQDASATVAKAIMQIGFSPVIPINQQITVRVAWGRYP